MTESTLDALKENFNPALQDGTARYGLSDEAIAEIVAGLSDESMVPVAAILDNFSTTDTAELLAKVSSEDRRLLLERYGEKFDPYVFSELDPDLRRDTLNSLPAAKVAALLSDLDSDDALDMILPLDPVFQKEIIRNLSARTRIALEEGLNFPEDSAGRLMQREFVAIPQFWTVGKVIDYLRAAADELPDDFFDLFVITPNYHVVGEIPLNKVIRSQRNVKIESLTLDEIHPVNAETDQEEVAHMFRREGLVSAPVVDNDGRLIGVITVDDIVDVIDEEAQEDIMYLAGVERGDLYRAVWSTGASRFRWLFLNLITAILASVVIGFFEGTIQELVALAVLMPIVASMGGNAGTQTLTVAVRAIAARQLSGANAWRTIWKESLVGLMNGAAFAVIMGIAAGLWFQNPALGVIIAVAMIINLIVAGFGGAAIPILLQKAGADPAVASAVFLTTVTDIIGFFAFLGLAAVFLI